MGLHVLPGYGQPLLVLLPAFLPARLSRARPQSLPAYLPRAHPARRDRPHRPHRPTGYPWT